MKDDHIIKKFKPHKWAANYEEYRDFLKSDENTVEVEEDKSYLEWYENWKKENFNNEK
tara:strand:- start:746 stop:919 length:174 start_codon:yes stop_codon:yes gene_type:complete